MTALKKDSFLTGLIPGLILPLVGFYIYFLLFFRYMGFSSFVNHLVKINMLVSVLSLGVILNLVVFFFFYQKQLDRSARGVIAATFIYAGIVVYFKVL
jgi:hypothetical protein